MVVPGCDRNGVNVTSFRISWFCQFSFVHDVAGSAEPLFVQGNHSPVSNKNITIIDEQVRKVAAMDIKRI